MKKIYMNIHSKEKSRKWKANSAKNSAIKDLRRKDVLEAQEFKDENGDLTSQLGKQFICFCVRQAAIHSR